MDREANININIKVKNGIESFNEAPPRISEFRRFSRVFFGRPVVIIGFSVILLLILIAIFAPLIAPYNPYQQNLAIALQHPSVNHWLGTDEYGRDILSRVIYGSRVSLEVGIIAILVASAIGVTLGSLSGYFGGWLDMVSDIYGCAIRSHDD